ncbi:hypothetical protein D3C80_2200480 [compost metagenome]
MLMSNHPTGNPIGNLVLIIIIVIAHITLAITTQIGERSITTVSGSLVGIAFLNGIAKIAIL